MEKTREIKFRAWDGKKFHFFTALSGLYGVIPVAIHQFTGRKNKNGTEIYEGDIMCWPKYEGTKNQARWVVEWDNERSEYTKWHPKNDAEMIGNICENPELLK